MTSNSTQKVDYHDSSQKHTRVHTHTHTHTHTQKKRETDRQTDRQTETETERQRDLVFFASNTGSYMEIFKLKLKV